MILKYINKLFLIWLLSLASFAQCNNPYPLAGMQHPAGAVPRLWDAKFDLVTITYRDTGFFNKPHGINPNSAELWIGD